ncbi:hypothetical protein KIL84_018317 [Mauremys mutica]|uniref:Uncharacterized protein n=1 Tax=Mauremys mutica TaxID=74926 RepID=A0A9D3XT02_9SAUR|nr:hypothetical protein KIL84_018317 [Mauremys mutica]
MHVGGVALGGPDRGGRREAAHGAELNGARARQERPHCWCRPMLRPRAHWLAHPLSPTRVPDSWLAPSQTFCPVLQGLLSQEANAQCLSAAPSHPSQELGQYRPLQPL